jgi:hypothetical protein
MTWVDAKATLTDWRLYAHYIIYFCKAVPFSSLSLFTPSITSGLGYTSVEAQLMSGKSTPSRCSDDESLIKFSSTIRGCIYSHDYCRLLLRSLRDSSTSLRGIHDRRRHRLHRLSSPTRNSVHCAIWLLNYSMYRVICLHSATTRMAVCKPAYNSSGRVGDCAQCLVWCSWSDCRGVDI